LTFPTATHAYRALSTVDAAARGTIRDAENFHAAERAAGQAPVRPDWASLQDAAMHTVLRARFSRQPDLADVLAGTGDGRIEYHGSSRYWDGRLLETVRSEIVAERAGLRHADKPARGAPASDGRGKPARGGPGSDGRDKPARRGPGSDGRATGTGQSGSRLPGNRHGSVRIPAARQTGTGPAGF
jgi:hypothetical protein